MPATGQTAARYWRSSSGRLGWLLRIEVQIDSFVARLEPQAKDAPIFTERVTTGGLEHVDGSRRVDIVRERVSERIATATGRGVRPARCHLETRRQTRSFVQFQTRPLPDLTVVVP